MADIQGIQKLVCELKDKKLAENAIAKLAELAGSPAAEGALVQVRASWFYRNVVSPFSNSQVKRCQVQWRLTP